MFSFLKKRRRQRLRSEPFPSAWLTIIERNFAIYDRLPQGDQRELQGHIQVFLAEKLFEQDGSADGAPILEHRSQYVSWARVLSEDYDQLRRNTEKGRRNVLDKYGATNPAEFFAVATECFFEKPIPLRRKHPQLYEELKAYYRQDPALLMSS